MTETATATYSTNGAVGAEPRRCRGWWRWVTGVCKDEVKSMRTSTRVEGSVGLRTKWCRKVDDLRDTVVYSQSRPFSVEKGRRMFTDEPLDRRAVASDGSPKGTAFDWTGERSGTEGKYRKWERDTRWHPPRRRPSLLVPTDWVVQFFSFVQTLLVKQSAVGGKHLPLRGRNSVDWIIFFLKTLGLEFGLRDFTPTGPLFGVPFPWGKRRTSLS